VWKQLIPVGYSSKASTASVHPMRADEHIKFFDIEGKFRTLAPVHDRIAYLKLTLHDLTKQRAQHIAHGKIFPVIEDDESRDSAFISGSSCFL
jgi:hypothetical protein